MLDQSFSAENFRKILDLENRKGVHVEDKLSLTNVRSINEKIKQVNIKIRYSRKIKDKENLKLFYEDKKALREQRERELNNELERISQKIAKSDFKIELNRINIPGKKPIYTTSNIAEYYFAIKQTQRNISRLYGVKQADRNAIVTQVISLLSDGFPKYVIRTDVKDFYESISHSTLLNKIINDNLLAPFSKNILKSVLKSYEKESGSDKGIPRGIGVSAYLAELYMRDIDNEILDLKSVTYYARYVDDIIIIFTPSPDEGSRNYLQEIKTICESNHNTILNPAKTVVTDVRTPTNCSLDYLGYKIIFGAHTVKVKLTHSKTKKYRDRISLAFDDYRNLAKVNEKSARKVLVKRIRFLTGNTRLSNNKKKYTYRCILLQQAFK
ncbi:MAG: antiviral reverse transcriptase Drt3a [Cyclobacteriaceae bacterium]